jgi:uncharacterized protein
VGGEPDAPAPVKQAPRIRGGLTVRVISLLFGLSLFGVGIVSLLESRLGLAPWDVLHLGIAKHSPLTFGQAGIAVGLVILAVAWMLGQSPGFGTVANAVLIGLFVDLYSSFAWVQRLSEASVLARSGLLLSGVVLFGVATAFYIGAGLGAGPRDSMMLVLSRRSGKRIGLVRAVLEVSALALGVLLGGVAGVGTIAVAALVGPSVEIGFWLLYRTGLAKPTEAVRTAVEGAAGAAPIIDTASEPEDQPR